MHRGLAVGALTAFATAFVTALCGLLLSAYATSAQAQDSARLERHAWAADTAWAPQLDWLEQRLEACRAASGSYAADPCDKFISEALDRIYGIADFRDGAQGGQVAVHAGYLGMSAVLSAVRYGGSGWTQLGNGRDQAALDQAQARANAGDAVLAALPTASGGHVALILPGETVASSSWQRRVPNSASLFISNSKRSYLGKPLSFSFGGDTSEQVVFFAHSAGGTALAGEPSQPPEAQPMAQGDAPFEDADQETSYLVAPVEGGISGLEANAPPQLANALAAADRATRNDEAVAETAAGVYGLWCEAGGSGDPDKIKALVINGTGGVLSWGHLDKARSYAFEGEIARPIVKIERNGAIVSISFTEPADGAEQSTAFFVLDGKDKLFESHIFDANGELRPKDTILERCPGRQKQTAGG